VDAHFKTGKSSIQRRGSRLGTNKIKNLEEARKPGGKKTLWTGVML